MGREPVAKTRIEKILKGEAIPPVEDIDYFLKERLNDIHAKSMPEITAEDEGKVLTVENGEAVWGEGGGSCLVPTPTTNEVGYILTVTEEDDPSSTITVIPEQSVVFEYGYGNPENVTIPLDDPVGTIVTVFFGDTTINLTKMDEERVIYALGEQYWLEYYPAQGDYPAGWEFGAFPDSEPFVGTVTISAQMTEKKAVPSWEKNNIIPDWTGVPVGSYLAVGADGSLQWSQFPS